MASLRIIPHSTAVHVRSVFSHRAVEHPYHRLRAVPAAHRSFNATSYFRDGSQSSKNSEDAAAKRVDKARQVFEQDAKEPAAGDGLSSSPSIKENKKSSGAPKNNSSASAKVPSHSKVNKSEGSSSANSSFEDIAGDWESTPNFDIEKFSELPHSNFGINQHIMVNEEFKEALRQVLWQFRAPIRYAFAYGSGVFPQQKSDGRMASAEEITRVHPKAPPAVQRAQDGTPKMIDFIFGVTFTDHWHSLNLRQHRDHYSGLGYLGSGALSFVQDRMGAGVYFNTHTVVNGILIKYGVVNLDTLCRDLTEWDTLYLAGRLQKPVKILRDNARVRLANQMNLLSALRTALLLLPERFTELELHNTIAGISYLGDPRMTLPTENPQKVSNIVGHNLPNFRRLYNPLIENLPNVEFEDSLAAKDHWKLDSGIVLTLRQDMDPARRGNMVRRLPKAFRSKLYFQYQRKFQIPQVEFDEMMSSDAASASSKDKGKGFEVRIAQDDPAQLRKNVREVIKRTIGWPSTTQSLKGLLTGGLRKSAGYVWEKVEKYRAGRRKAASVQKKGSDEPKKSGETVEKKKD